MLAIALSNAFKSSSELRFFGESSWRRANKFEWFPGICVVFLPSNHNFLQLLPPPYILYFQKKQPLGQRCSLYLHLWLVQ